MNIPKDLINVDYLCEYSLECPQHGRRSALWIVDESPTGENMSEILRDYWDRQNAEVSFPNHIDCETITLIEERITPWNINKRMSRGSPIESCDYEHPLEVV